MRKQFLIITLLLITVSVFLSSCATIFGRSSYPVAIDTNPPGVDVSITDKKGREVYKGKSPATVVLKSSAGYFSKAEYQVRLSSVGYAEQVVPVNYKINGWYFGNVLVGGLLGMLVVDPATGAMWKLDTPPIYVTLNKSTTSTTSPTLKIMDIKDVPQNMKEYLVKVK